MNYLINKKAELGFFSRQGEQECLDISMFECSLNETHQVIEKITKDIPVDVFSILGMRNLSAFIGEIFAESLVKNSRGQFIGNPHQDGYPDLLLMNHGGLAAFERLRSQKRLREKAPFSPFEYGGIEIKATCGSVPTPKECARRGVEKPDIGDQRIGLVKAYDWKAHHRETNNLVGIFWDFYLGVPHIMGVFFGASLDERDWGKIVQPKEGGGRTTSVSIMTRDGVRKMYRNWIAVKNDNKYINFFNSYNNGDLVKG